MNNIVCDFIKTEDLVLGEEELAKRLQSPNPLENETIRNCIEKVLDVCKPRYCYAKTSVLIKDADCEFEFMRVNSVSLAKALKGCGSAYVLALTLGIEADRLITSLGVTSKADSFIADAVASAIAESAVEYVCSHLEAHTLAQRFSAGYGDFVLSNQEKILNYLKADKLLGIKLGTSCIMTPRKSVTAIIGVKE